MIHHRRPKNFQTKRLLLCIPVFLVQNNNTVHNFINICCNFTFCLTNSLTMIDLFNKSKNYKLNTKYIYIINFILIIKNV